MENINPGTFCENSQRLKAAIYFQKKFLSYMFNMILNTPLASMKLSCTRAQFYLSTKFVASTTLINLTIYLSH